LSAQQSQIMPIAPESVLLRRNLAGLVLRIRRNDGNLPARTGKVVVRSGRQTEQPSSLAHLDRPRRLDLKLVSFAGHQSAVRNRRMVNSILPPGSSRQRSTSLM
jgi:hypothetical protein